MGKPAQINAGPWSVSVTLNLSESKYCDGSAWCFIVNVGDGQTHALQSTELVGVRRGGVLRDRAGGVGASVETLSRVGVVVVSCAEGFGRVVCDEVVAGSLARDGRGEVERDGVVAAVSACWDRVRGRAWRGGVEGRGRGGEGTLRRGK